MNLRDLQYLVAVADHRHFGRAAEACYVSQPTLSTQIKKLEAELGVALLERSPRKVLLTAAGERVVERARALLGEADDIVTIARQAQDPEAGELRLGLFPTLAPYLLPHVVPDLHRRFPRLELLLVEEKTEELLRQVREGRLDAAVLALPLGDPQLHCEPLFSEEFVLAVPADHRLAAGPAAGAAGGGPTAADATGARADEPVSVGVLADEPVLLLEEGHCLREQALSVCRSAGAPERDGFRATSLETLRQMVTAGVGITLLPVLATMPPVPPSPDLRLRRFAEPVPRRDVAMVWRPSSVRTPLLESVAALLRDRASALLGPA